MVGFFCLIYVFLGHLCATVRGPKNLRDFDGLVIIEDYICTN